MYAAGMRTFLEIGPGARLTGMVRSILGDRDYQTVTLDASNGQRSTVADLGRALAKLAALGYSLNLSLWDGDFAGSQAAVKKKRGLSVSLCGANAYQAPDKRPPLRVQAPAPVQATQQAPSRQRAQQLSSAAPAPPSEQIQTAAAGQNLHEALRITQQSLQALQSLQEQTAKLHQQFLEGQQAATQSFMGLVQQQQQLMQGPALGAPRSTMEPHVQPAPVAAALRSTPAAPATAADAAAAVAPVPAGGAVTGTQPGVAPILLAIIAEKTGYPVEMLELDMALDSDLGIDSIKRVEILSSVQEAMPDAPLIKPEDLGRLQTLGQIVDHLNSSTLTIVPTVRSATSGVDVAHIQTTLLDVIADKTGYPVEMLELDMALDSDLGIDSIKRVEILSALQEQLPQLPAVKPEDLGVLQTLGQIVDHLTREGADTSSAAVPASSPDRANVTTTLLDVIADKTGYPVDMLELDMALDSDLGIDSIKRVEILSALQEQLPQLPAVKPEDLSVLQTLDQIVDHLTRGVGPLAQAGVASGATAGIGKKAITAVLLEVIADKTGYPVDMLELDMALDSDLGIDSIKRVEIFSALQEKMPELPTVKPEDLGVLQTLEQIVDHLAQGGVNASRSFHQIHSWASWIKQGGNRSAWCHCRQDWLPGRDARTRHGA